MFVCSFRFRAYSNLLIFRKKINSSFILKHIKLFIRLTQKYYIFSRNSLKSSIVKNVWSENLSSPNRIRILVIVFDSFNFLWKCSVFEWVRVTWTLDAGQNHSSQVLRISKVEDTLSLWNCSKRLICGEAY